VIIILSSGSDNPIKTFYSLVSAGTNQVGDPVLEHAVKEFKHARFCVDSKYPEANIRHYPIQTVLL